MLGAEGRWGLEGQWQAQLSIMDGCRPTASAEEPSWASLAMPLSDTRGSHTPQCPEETGLDGLSGRMQCRMFSTYRQFGCEQPLCSSLVHKATVFQAMEN